MTQNETLEAILKQQQESNTLKQQILGKINLLETRLTSIESLIEGIAKLQGGTTTNPYDTQQATTLDQGIEWRPYKSGKGAWTFTTNQGGSPNQKTKPLVEAIHKAGGKLETATHTYKLSGEGDKFIAKYPK